MLETQNLLLGTLIERLIRHSPFTHNDEFRGMVPDREGQWINAAELESALATLPQQEQESFQKLFHGHLVDEVTHAHLGLDRLGAPKTKRVTNRSMMGKQDITLTVAERFAALPPAPPQDDLLTKDDLLAAALACEAQGNIHNLRQSEEEGIATVNCTRGNKWKKLATKFAGAGLAASPPAQEPLKDAAEAVLNCLSRSGSWACGICGETSGHLLTFPCGRLSHLLTMVEHAAAPAQEQEP